jgi:hypothetical protein
MKTRKIFGIAMVAIAGATLMSCGGSKQAAQSTAAQSVATPPTMSTTTKQVPCWQPDNDEWYTGTAARRSSVNRMNTLGTTTLRAARVDLQQKIKGSLKQVTRNYLDQMDIDENSSEAAHIEGAGDYVVNQMLNDMLETCREVTSPDAQGMIIMYVGVKISKKAVVDNLVKGLSQDEKTKLRFDEKTFRDDAFKVFTKDRQDSFDDYKNAREQ